MKKLFLALLATATALAITPSAMATPITGSMGVSGAVESYTASTIMFDADGLVSPAIDDSGTLALAAGESVALNGGTYPNTLTLSGGGANGVELFATDTGSTAVTFTIGTYSYAEDVFGNLSVAGTGTITETGYSSTAGTFDLSTAKAGSSFTFSSDVGVPPPVPEPSSLLLLGTGLLGLAFVAFRKTKSSGVVLSM